MVFGSFMPIIMWLLMLLVLYFVIMLAVKHGINQSVVGKYFAKKLEDKNEHN